MRVLLLALMCMSAFAQDLVTGRGWIDLQADLDNARTKATAQSFADRKLKGKEYLIEIASTKVDIHGMRVDGNKSDIFSLKPRSIVREKGKTTFIIVLDKPSELFQRDEILEEWILKRFSVDFEVLGDRDDIIPNIVNNGQIAERVTFNYIGKRQKKIDFTKYPVSEYKITPIIEPDQGQVEFVMDYNNSVIYVTRISSGRTTIRVEIEEIESGKITRSDKEEIIDLDYNQVQGGKPSTPVVVDESKPRATVTETISRGDTFESGIGTEITARRETEINQGNVWLDTQALLEEYMDQKCVFEMGNEAITPKKGTMIQPKAKAPCDQVRLNIKNFDFDVKKMTKGKVKLKYNIRAEILPHRFEEKFQPYFCDYLVWLVDQETGEYVTSLVDQQLGELREYKRKGNTANLSFKDGESKPYFRLLRKKDAKAKEKSYSINHRLVCTYGYR